MKKKDPQQLLTNALNSGMPVLVLVAKDKCATEAISAYYDECHAQKCKEDHLNGVANIHGDFIEWQDANPDKVKLPD